MARREYVGNAPATTLNGAITAVSATITITDGTNWPTGASFPFVVIIDRGLAAEEKVLITSRTGNVLTVNTRGFDSTTAASHADGATIEHGLSATDINEVNDHTFDTTNDDHTQYLNNARHDVEARHTFGAALGTPVAPANIGTAASAGSGNNPAREDHIHTTDAWATWTPTFTNFTLGNGTIDYARFQRNGPTVDFRLKVTLGSTSSMGTDPTFSLPVTRATYGATHPIGTVLYDTVGSLGHVWAQTTTTGRMVVFAASGSFATAVAVTATAPQTWATGHAFLADGSYEAA